MLLDNGFDILKESCQYSFNILLQDLALEHIPKGASRGAATLIGALLMKDMVPEDGY